MSVKRPDAAVEPEAQALIPSFKNAPLVFGEIALIPLKPAGFAVIDADDIDLVSDYTWRLVVFKSGHVYAQTTYWKNGKSHTINMQRLIMGTPAGKQTDHRSCNGLDNRRSNLRVATYSQNQQNSRPRRDKKASRFKGVSYNARDKKWQSSIRINGKKVSLGCFKTETEAAAAYQSAAIKHFGEFARTNFDAAINNGA